MTEEPKTSPLAHVAVIAGSLWLAAGALFKLFAGTPADLPPDIAEWIGKSNLSLFFHVAIGIELSTVALAWFKPKLGWFFLACTFVVFLIVLTPGVMRGDESCGCMGGSIKIPPIVMMSIDGLLLLAILFTKPWKNITWKGLPLILVGLIVAGCAAAPWLVIESGSKPPQGPGPGGPGPGPGPGPVEPGPRFVILDMASWVGTDMYSEEFELRKHIDGDVDTLHPDGPWIFWRVDCDHCKQHLMDMASADDGSPVTLIQIPDHKGDPVVELMPEGGHVMKVLLREGPTYVIETPADLVMEGGTVAAFREGIEVE